ncbi:amidohydrolase family protein [Kribbella sandramycini]|uniref:Amidohydrolase family protein n=1 Tax=Kribbella sandramycini TaxID=60450 RepID=A0A7Y4P192_9ACTN|nr:amidohydrolase family protein [Kribbella sandramycini]MBB6571146.1 N-acetylglucosamine-6-phosphate deacetylase [Kribbella sandramycini]NOL43446.1 amidohydrolase family protein [Kribbella sandramycini]
MTTLTGASLVVDDQLVDGAALVVRDGRIEAIVSTDAVRPAADVVDLTGHIVVPGLIDLHVHGGGGHSFDTPDPAAHREILAFHARHGVTTMQASLVSAHPEELDRQLDALSDSVGAGLFGVHLEGPYLAVSQCGAHDPAALRPPSAGEADRLLARGNLVRMVTVAPELDGIPAFVRRLTDAGVVVAAGHSEARGPELAAAVASGLSHLTHLWSCQSALVREGPWRVPGLLEESLASNHLIGEIIADGHHLPPALIEIARRCLGDRLVVVSDATAGAGMPEGYRYRLGVIDCEVASGVGMVVGQDAFGGSTTPLDGMLRHLHQTLGWPLPEAVAATSTRPARVLGLGDRKGRLAAAYDADLTVLTPALTVAATLRAGEWIHR